MTDIVTADCFELKPPWTRSSACGSRCGIALQRAEEPIPETLDLVARGAIVRAHQKIPHVQRQLDLEGADQAPTGYIALRQDNAPEHHAGAVDSRLHCKLRQREPG